MVGRRALTRYASRHLAQAVLSVFGVVTLTFLVLRITGNPVNVLLPPNATSHQRAQLIRQLGLNSSVLAQYVRFLDQVVHGRFGESIVGGGNAATLVLSQMKPSLELIGITIVAATVIGLLGAVAAVSTQGRFLDRAITSLAAVAQAMPSFWLALLLILVFAVHLAVLPATGMTGVSSIVLPVATLTVALVPYVLRVARSSILETFREDFIRFQVARGIPARSILFKHALRSSLAPVVAMIGLQTGLLLSGVVVIEQIFGRSGIGRLLLTAILQRNYPVVQAAVIAIAIVVVLANLLADLLIAALDPRVRLAHGSAT